MKVTEGQEESTGASNVTCDLTTYRLGSAPDQTLIPECGRLRTIWSVRRALWPCDCSAPSPMTRFLARLVHYI